MTKKPKMVRKELSINENDDLTIESVYHKLHQELLKGKRSGTIRKRERLKEIDVLRAIIKLGLKEIQTLSYIEFEKLRET